MVVLDKAGQFSSQMSVTGFQMYFGIHLQALAGWDAAVFTLGKVRQGRVQVVMFHMEGPRHAQAVGEGCGAERLARTTFEQLI